MSEHSSSFMAKAEERLQAVIFDIGIVDVTAVLNAIAAEIVDEIVGPITKGRALKAQLGAAEIGAAVQIHARRIFALRKITRIELHQGAQRQAEGAIGAGDGKAGIVQSDFGLRIQPEHLDVIDAQPRFLHCVLDRG